jgi:cytochrome d ubiquinol oxidase subunit I
MAADILVASLSRLQFATTAYFHFLFVPLTLGISLFIAILMTTYLVTGKQIYREMARFWTKLFAINFAMGVATGITHEFEFGTNWAIYSRYVGDIFGAPLAIEALFAFFLESSFIGMLIFGWNRVNDVVMTLVAWAVAFGTNLSALWILLANGWMQHPGGALLKVGTWAGGVRAELADFSQVTFSPVADVKFMHTITAGMIVAAMFVLGISAYHLLKKQHVDFFKRSALAAAIFGLIASVSEVVIGDIHAHEVAKTQPSKLAAMEAVVDSEHAAPILLAAWVTQNENGQYEYAFKLPLPIPGILSFLAYHNFSAQVPGLNDVQKYMEQNFAAIMNEYKAKGYPELAQIIENNVLLNGQWPSFNPPVNIVYWAFHLMVYLGFLFVFIFGVAFYYAKKGVLDQKSWILKVAFYSIPLPYIASLLGWATAEVGRQPWVVYPLTEIKHDANGNILWNEMFVKIPALVEHGGKIVNMEVPGAFMGLTTYKAVTPTLTVLEVAITFLGFLIIFSILTVIDWWLLVKYAKKGPDFGGQEKAQEAY